MGVKVVEKDKNVESGSQNTQTSVQDDTQSDINIIIAATPECGIRIIGADEVFLAKRDRELAENVSLLSVPRDSLCEVLSNHSRMLKDKITRSNMSTYKDKRPMHRSTHSVVMFSGLAEEDEPSGTDLHANAVADGSLESSSLYSSSTGSEKNSPGLVKHKSIQIYDTPVVIASADTEYADDDDDDSELTARRAIFERRSTGYNFQYKFLSDDNINDGDNENGALGSILLRGY